MFGGVLLFPHCIRRSDLSAAYCVLLYWFLCLLTSSLLVLQYVTAMIGLFGEASDRLCEKLDKAAVDGEDVEMESLFSRFTLDVIGKAVFNYDFDSLSYDNGIVEVIDSSFPLFPVSFIYGSSRLKPFSIVEP